MTSCASYRMAEWEQQCGAGGAADNGHTEAPHTRCSPQAPILLSDDLDFCNSPPLRAPSLDLTAFWHYISAMNS